MDPNNRLSALVELGTPREPPSSLPIDKYFQILMEMFQLASNYASGGDDEKAFVLFLRFIRFKKKIFKLLNFFFIVLLLKNFQIMMCIHLYQ